MAGVGYIGGYRSVAGFGGYGAGYPTAPNYDVQIERARDLVSAVWSLGTSGQSGGTSGAVSGRVLRIGMTGDDVLALQSALSTLGFQVAVSGMFDDATDQAVRAFQASVSLAPDGAVGPRTGQAIQAALSAPRVTGPPLAPNGANPPRLGSSMTVAVALALSAAVFIVVVSASGRHRVRAA